MKPGDVTDFLRSLPQLPHLLGLGEPTHGEEQFPRLRNEIFQHLVEHEGYRSFALESDCLMGLTVDDYIATGEGTIDDATSKGFSHGFGAYEANRELVAWMRDYNASRPTEDQLRFYGFDAPLEIHSAPSPGPALTVAHRYLADHLDPGQLPFPAEAILQLVKDDARWSDPETVLDATRSVGGSDDANRLRLLADEVLTQVFAHSPHLIAATSRADWWRAQLHARSAAGLLRYHAVLADQRVNRIEKGSAVRDTLMADNLTAIREYEGQRGSTLVFAANSHLQLNKSLLRIPQEWTALAGETLEWWSAAAVAAARLGRQEYAFLAMDFGEPPLRGLHTSAQLAAMHGLQSNAPTDYRYIPFDLSQLDGLDGIIFVEKLSS
jgi:erythromycin esterase-like protein